VTGSSLTLIALKGSRERQALLGDVTPDREVTDPAVRRRLVSTLMAAVDSGAALPSDAQIPVDVGLGELWLLRKEWESAAPVLSVEVTGRILHPSPRYWIVVDALAAYGGRESSRADEWDFNLEILSVFDDDHWLRIWSLHGELQIRATRVSGGGPVLWLITEVWPFV
jgi:hypothetical protein